MYDCNTQSTSFIIIASVSRVSGHTCMHYYWKMVSMIYCKPLWWDLGCYHLYPYTTMKILLRVYSAPCLITAIGHQNRIPLSKLCPSFKIRCDVTSGRKRACSTQNCSKTLTLWLLSWCTQSARSDITSNLKIGWSVGLLWSTGQHFVMNMQPSKIAETKTTQSCCVLDYVLVTHTRDHDQLVPQFGFLINSVL